MTNTLSTHKVHRQLATKRAKRWSVNELQMMRRDVYVPSQFLRLWCLLWWWRTWQGGFMEFCDGGRSLRCGRNFGRSPAIIVLCLFISKSCAFFMNEKHLCWCSGTWLFLRFTWSPRLLNPMYRSSFFTKWYLFQPSTNSSLNRQFGCLSAWNRVC